MTSSERQSVCPAVHRRKRLCTVLLLALTGWSAASQGATVRDNFESRNWGNNDGTTNWSGDWIEVDGNSTPPSPTNGNV